MNMMLTGTVPVPLPLDDIRPWNSARQMLVCTSVVDEAAGGEDLHLCRRGRRLVPLHARPVHHCGIAGQRWRPAPNLHGLVVALPALFYLDHRQGTAEFQRRHALDVRERQTRFAAFAPTDRADTSRSLRNPAKKYLFISAGSGITPMMSMLRWLSDCDPGSGRRLPQLVAPAGGDHFPRRAGNVRTADAEPVARLPAGSSVRRRRPGAD
jgi:hypothetical protein